MIHALRFFAASALALLALPTSAAWFLPLPQLPGATEPGDAYAVSADGMIAVGTSHDGRSTNASTNQAVRWTTSGAIMSLNAGDSSFTRGVSGDGSVAAGYRIADRGFPVAFRWTQSGGSMELGDFPGGELASTAHDVSQDGNVVVGIGSPAQGSQAFRWTAATGMVGLGDLPGGSSDSEAFGVSRDGSVIVGSSISSNGFEAFRWTQETGMVGLGDLPGDGFFSEAYGVSADGSVIVGKSAGTNPISFSAFRWTAAAGMTELPALPSGARPAIAETVSGNGFVIGGAAIEGNSAVGFVWDQFHGTCSVAQLLQDQGVDLDGFKVGKVNGISYDGLTLVGSGQPRDSLSFQPWIARLNEGAFVPEPSSLCLLSLAAAIGFGLFAWRLRLGRRLATP